MAPQAEAAGRRRAGILRAPALANQVYARPVGDASPHPPASAAAEQPTAQWWVRNLRPGGPERDDALARLHGLMVRASRFELGRRQGALAHVRGEELEDIAMQAADDAMMAVLAKLDDFRGESRFTTWAYKFAIVEAGVKLRRRAWQDREVLVTPEAWDSLGQRAASAPGEGEELHRLKAAIDSALTSRQREVFVALALNEVPIDVLAERLNTTRGALYKALHDARRKLRRVLAAEAGGTEVPS